MQIIIMLVVRMITPPTNGTAIGIILLDSNSTLKFNVGGQVFVKGVGAVSVVAPIHSAMKSVSVPGTM